MRGDPPKKAGDFCLTSERSGTCTLRSLFFLALSSVKKASMECKPGKVARKPFRPAGGSGLSEEGADAERSLVRAAASISDRFEVAVDGMELFDRGGGGGVGQYGMVKVDGVEADLSSEEMAACSSFCCSCRTVSACSLLPNSAD